MINPRPGGPSVGPAMTGHATVLHTLDGMDAATYGTLRNHLTATGHLGGSMAASVLGLNPWVSPMRAWLQLRGEDTDPVPDTWAMKIGRAMESGVLELFQLETGRRVHTPRLICQHPDLPWAICTPDGLIEPAGDDGWGVFEAKVTSERLGTHWDDGNIADPAHAQVLHNMWILGLDYAYIAAMVGTRRFEIRRIDRDEALIALLAERETAFIHTVIENAPPAWEGRDASLIATRFPPERVEEMPIELPPEAYALANAYRVQSEYEKQAKAAKLEAQVQLEALLGDHAEGTCRDVTVSWRPVERKAYSVQAGTYRRFAVKETS